MLPERSTRAGILPGRPSLGRGSLEAESGMVARHRKHVTAERLSFIFLSRTGLLRDKKTCFNRIIGSNNSDPSCEVANSRRRINNTTHLNREATHREQTGDRKVSGSNPSSASLLLPSRLGQPRSILALVLPSGGVAARCRKGDAAERLLWTAEKIGKGTHCKNPHVPKRNCQR
ncbi:hypothetical protein T265_06281 [Opisthorchis viverrini]|uniref:Uncharacterized protein n=1 Tax=Opisthorchis viverrini TaxID=6198 RepID=A0A074ZH12_OPIVI|nr:hypothetical protein T265_06281 [Opisthorchis viverrini]KER26493.1 hypothetical protein T265_06281 [Opisthorchis viverrini]